MHSNKHVHNIQPLALPRRIRKSETASQEEAHRKRTNVSKFLGRAGVYIYPLFMPEALFFLGRYGVDNILNADELSHCLRIGEYVRFFVFLCSLQYIYIGKLSLFSSGGIIREDEIREIENTYMYKYITLHFNY